MVEKMISAATGINGADRGLGCERIIDWLDYRMAGLIRGNVAIMEG